MRVDIMPCCGTIEKRLALLPVLTHRSPVGTGGFHEVSIILPCLLLSEDLLTFIQQLHALVRHAAVGSDNRVFNIRLHCALQRRLFVRGDIRATILTSAQSYQADERE